LCAKLEKVFFSGVGVAILAGRRLLSAVGPVNQVIAALLLHFHSQITQPAVVWRGVVPGSV
jgi:hypothetical protein